MNPLTLAPVLNLAFCVVLGIAIILTYLKFLEFDIKKFQITVCLY